MNKFLIIIILSGFISEAYSQDTIYKFGEEPEKIAYFLGFRIIPTFDASVQFAEIYAPQGKPEEIVLISSNTFLAYAKGITKCDANPQKTNFLETYGIKDEKVLNDLWRIRYKDYPFKTPYGDSTAGWSTNDSSPSLPSEKQFQLLNQYGIYKISDFAFGPNAFRLLKALETESWITAYKSAF